MANYFHSFLSYFNKDKETKRSKEIDRRLRKERIKSCKVLIAGLIWEAVGKSTIFKQLQLQYLGKFREEIQQNKKYQIRDNLMYKFRDILEEMKTFSPPIKLDNPENETKAQWIIEIEHRWDSESNINYSPEFYDCIKILYKDVGVQQALERKRRDEYCLVDNLIYFLDKIDVISKEDYAPTNQDILRYRECIAIDYINFRVDNWDFLFLEYRCCVRPKWPMLDDLDAIIFIADCSYDKKPLDDCNSLQFSLDVFKTFADRKYRPSKATILFLNKIDIFEQKFVSDKSKFEEYFPEFRNFTLPNIDETNRYSEVLKAKYFIKHKFEMCWDLGDNCTPGFLYQHFTCAIDTVNIQQTFAACFIENAFTFSLY